MQNILNNIFKQKKHRKYNLSKYITVTPSMQKPFLSEADTLLAEMSSVFISATPNSKNNANLKVCGANQRIDYKSRAYTGCDTRLHSFNGK